MNLNYVIFPYYGIFLNEKNKFFYMKLFKIDLLFFTKYCLLFRDPKMPKMPSNCQNLTISKLKVKFLQIFRLKSLLLPCFSPGEYNKRFVLELLAEDS